MGQKSNLITLQKNKKSLNLLTQNPKLFLKGFNQVEIRECHSSTEPRLGTEVLIKCSN